MATDDIHDLLSRDPFDPFRVRLTSGDHYDIRNPSLVVMMRSRLFIAMPNSNKSIVVPYFHIAALVTLQNGHNGSRRHKRRR